MLECENVGPSYFRDKLLLVSDIFCTFQGEQPFSGQPAVFLRLAGCNRGAKGDFCGVMCDTDFRLSKATPHGVGRLAYSLQEKAEKYKNKPLLVITGGEPFLQTKVLMVLLAYLKELDCFSIIQFETNGDIDPTAIDSYMNVLLYWEKVHVVVSPKANNKTGFSKELKFPSRFVKTFRCVVRNDIVSPHNSYPEWVDNYPDIPLFLSPMTVYYDKETWERNNSEPYSLYVSRLQNCFDAGWSDLIDTEKTRDNYIHAATLAKSVSMSRRNCGLSCQTHLFFGAK